MRRKRLSIMATSTMFCDIQSVSIPGSMRSASNLTEDAFSVSQSSLIVMDGATVVNGDSNHFADNASDAHWLSHKGCSMLSARFDEMARNGNASRLHIETAIFECLCSLEREYMDATHRKVSLMTPADAPSSTLSAAVVSEGKLYIAQLGDSPISIKMKDGSFRHFIGDENLLALDEKNKRDMSELMARGWDVAAAHNVLLPQFSEMRELHCNNGKGDSYRIFCFVGKEHAKPRVESFIASDVDSICLYSDGYADTFLFEPGLSPDELHTRSVADLRSSVIALLGHVTDDMECVQYPRFKASDDITAIAAKLA